jgi:aspartyl-tRNA(Asn)/glutamyl-tRNA(Gln) amidotransferase subunit B
MGWNETRGETYAQRGKEHAHDYRYFPEPDLLPLQIAREQVERIQARLPELPDAKRDRFMTQYGLSRYDAHLLVADRTIAEYFESCVSALQPLAPGLQTAASKTIANWMTGELFRLMNEAGDDMEQVKIKPPDLVALVELVGKGQVSQSTAKAVLKEMYDTGRSPAAIIERKGLMQISDAGMLEAIVERVLDENPDPLREYLGGKESIFKWLLGQVMRATRGQASPTVAHKVLRSALDRRRAPPI